MPESITQLSDVQRYFDILRVQIKAERSVGIDKEPLRESVNFIISAVFINYRINTLYEICPDILSSISKCDLLKTSGMVQFIKLFIGMIGIPEVRNMFSREELISFGLES